ncbi:ABC transporter permease [Rhodopila sp.]|uniref:ABC transporter permease n=1 Tax=Rhodopila sp. TaxID=2480087 RepID=UPI003D105733
MNPILRVLLYRLGSAVLVLFGVSIVIFVIARVIPGDPARIALGANASAQQVAALRAALYLDRPLPAQYAIFLGNLLHGDLGQSLYTNRPVIDDIAAFLPATLELIFVAALIMVLIGMPLGVLAAHWRGSPIDHAIRGAAVIAVSAPSFVWAVVFMLLFAYWLPWFPIAGQLGQSTPAPPDLTGFVMLDSLLAGEWTTLGDALYHVILPAAALAMAGIGQTTRMMRSSLIEIYDRPFIEMALAFGFTGRRIATRWALRPALIPTLTILGLDIAALLGNAFLVENVFAWPGLSRYGVQVILRKDLNAIIGTVLIIASAFIVMNIVVDLLANLLNPRIRLSEPRG